MNTAGAATLDPVLGKNMPRVQMHICNGQSEISEGRDDLDATTTDGKGGHASSGSWIPCQHDCRCKTVTNVNI